MKYETQAEIVTALKKWRDLHDRIEKADQAFRPLFGWSSFEGEVTGVMWEAFGSYTRELSENMGDKLPNDEPEWARTTWLEWYSDECDMGRKPMTCLIGGVEYKATRDLRSIARIILAWRSLP